MPLLVFNITGAPIALAGVAKIIPASAAPPAHSEAVNVTSELHGLTGPQYTALEAQRVSTGLAYQWTTSAEFSTGTLDTDVSLPLLALPFASIPNPDTLPVGTMVLCTDECPFVGVVQRRPHLEANGTQRRYYRQLVGASFSWKPTTAAPVTTNFLGRVDPVSGLLSQISNINQAPNCMIGQTQAGATPCNVQKMGNPTISTIAAAQNLVTGDILTWDATGSLIRWTPASPTAPLGFFVIGIGWPPISSASGGGSVVSYLPFI